MNEPSLENEADCNATLTLLFVTLYANVELSTIGLFCIVNKLTCVPVIPSDGLPTTFAA